MLVLPAGVLASEAAVAGAFLASFLSLVAWRVPRHLSVVRPASFCPACRRPLAWFELIPVVSWLALRGRCRTCGTPIPWREPVIEALGALLAWALVATWGLSWMTVWMGGIAFGFGALALLDSRRGRVPLAGLVAVTGWSLAGWAAARLGAPLVPPRAPLAGLGVMAGLWAVQALASRGRYGGADGWVGLLLGLLLGPTMALWAWVAGSALAGVAHLVGRGRRGRRRRRVLPFLPGYLAAGIPLLLPPVQLAVLHWFPYTVPLG